MDRRVITFAIALIAAIAAPLCASSGWARGLGVLGLGGGPAGGATGTDWTANSSLQALYSLESGVITADSGPNNQTMTCAGSCPDADTTNYVELLSSGATTQISPVKMMYLPRTEMVSTFPGNGTGDGNITIGCWVRISAYNSSKFVFNIRKSNGDNIYSMYFGGSDGTASAKIDATTANTVNFPATLSLNTWYFVAVIYSAPTLTAYIREYGAVSSSVSTVASSGTLDDMGSTGMFAIGGAFSGGAVIIGNVDAVAVFNRSFSQSELDSVFANGWDGNGW